MNGKKKYPRTAPAKTVEGREGQLINAAVELAEKQLLDGTASAQVITHFLKQGSLRAQLELERLRQENLLIAAKTEAIKSEKRLEDIYEEAVRAMELYKGSSHDEDL